MPRTLLVVVLAGLLISGCAHVPKESVELSAMLGRDLNDVHAAHTELASILFDRMRCDINRFVDDVYAPHQIRFVMQDELALAQDPDPVVSASSFITLFEATLEPGAPHELQTLMLDAMAAIVEGIHADVEDMRGDLLAPLEAQEREVLGSIDRAYSQLRHANSIVTGHLASVVRVHDAQAELLEIIGVDRNLRYRVSRNLATTATQIGEVVEDAERVSATIDTVRKDANKITDALSDLGEKLSGSD
jgi:hypothetical protein